MYKAPSTVSAIQALGKHGEGAVGMLGIVVGDRRKDGQGCRFHPEGMGSVMRLIHVTQ